MKAIRLYELTDPEITRPEEAEKLFSHLATGKLATKPGPACPAARTAAVHQVKP